MSDNIFTVVASQSLEQYYYEKTLVEIGRRYIDQDIEDPLSEETSNLLFDLAKLVTNPRTKAGKAIVEFVSREEGTDFSMACNDEYEVMADAIAAHSVAA